MRHRKVLFTTTVASTLLLVSGAFAAAPPSPPSAPPAAAAPAPPPGPAAAACLASVKSIEGQFNLAATPPAAPLSPAQGSLTDQLAQSKGVVTPPPTNDPAVITPPKVDNALPTTPPPDPSKPAPAGGLNAADRDFLEGVLIAARTAAERNDIAGCNEQLQKAQQFVATHSGK